MQQFSQFDFHDNPELQGHRLVEVKKIHQCLLPSPLTLDEASNIERLKELVLDEDWLKSKSYLTSSKASETGISNHFNQRWRDYKIKFLPTQDPPYRVIVVRHALWRCGVYFITPDFSISLETSVIADDIKVGHSKV